MIGEIKEELNEMDKSKEIELSLMGVDKAKVEDLLTI
jgi:hypothetical protein